MRFIIVDFDALLGRDELGNPCINEALMALLVRKSNVIIYAKIGAYLAGAQLTYATSPCHTPTEEDLRKQTIGYILERLESQGAKVLGVVTAYDAWSGSEPGVYFKFKVAPVEAEAPRVVAAYCRDGTELPFSEDVHSYRAAEGIPSFGEASPVHDAVRDHRSSVRHLFVYLKSKYLRERGADIHVHAVSASTNVSSAIAEQAGERVRIESNLISEPASTVMSHHWFESMGTPLARALRTQLSDMPVWRSGLVYDALNSITPAKVGGYEATLREACQPFGSVWNALARPYYGVFTIFPCAYGTEHSRAIDEIITPPKATDALLKRDREAAAEIA